MMRKEETPAVLQKMEYFFVSIEKAFLLVQESPYNNPKTIPVVSETSSVTMDMCCL